MGKETTFSRMRRRIWGSGGVPATKQQQVLCSSNGKRQSDPTKPPMCHEEFEEVTIVSSIMKKDEEVKEARRRRRSEVAISYSPKLLQQSLILPGKGTTTTLGDTCISHIVQKIPIRYRSRDLYMVYSTAYDGCSLNTLYRNIRGKDPILLVIKDTTGCIFGVYVSQYFYPQSHYSGTGETFLFDNENNAWEWSRRNKYFYLASNNSLAFGNGSSNHNDNTVAALWLDADLEHGRTGTSETFNNLPLANKEEFTVAVAEAYKLVLPKR